MRAEGFDCRHLHRVKIFCWRLKIASTGRLKELTVEEKTVKLIERLWYRQARVGAGSAGWLTWSAGPWWPASCPHSLCTPSPRSLSGAAGANHKAGGKKVFNWETPLWWMSTICYTPTKRTSDNTAHLCDIRTEEAAGGKKSAVYHFDINWHEQTTAWVPYAAWKTFKY